MDLFERGNILLTGCSLLVIDEADRMLDMGFIPDIENICTKLPANRQTLLFSATMPPPIKKLSDRFLSNPKSIEVARPATASANIAQMLVPVGERDKREMLRKLLKSEGVDSAIIFCNRKTMVRELNKSLKRHGFKSGEIHGDIDQSARIAELEKFKSGEINLLVASDVAARGLDIKGVSHVFNFDAPWHPDDYVHRIGRTGRAGATGKAFTFVTKQDAEAIDNIEKLIGNKIERLDTGVTIEESDDGGASRGRPARGDAKRGRGKSEERPAQRERDDRPARDEKSEAGERPARQARPAREARDERPARAERPARPDRSDRGDRGRDRPRRDDRQQDDGPDDGWNGPTPAFLNFGFDS
jgi:superfamily II DNA/RNA helicase